MMINIMDLVSVVLSIYRVLKGKSLALLDNNVL